MNDEIPQSTVSQNDSRTRRLRVNRKRMFLDSHKKKTTSVSYIIHNLHSYCKLRWAQSSTVKFRITNGSIHVGVSSSSSLLLLLLSLDVEDIENVVVLEVL